MARYLLFQESTVKFHIVGLKCLNCGSYNTCRIKGSPCSGDNQLLIDWFYAHGRLCEFSIISTDPDALNEAAGITEEKEGS